MFDQTIGAGKSFLRHFWLAVKFEMENFFRCFPLASKTNPQTNSRIFFSGSM